MDNKSKKLFPQRLWDLVHDARYNHFLRWSEDGQRVYLNRSEFEEHYLRTPNNQFHTQKAISFVRQMNMYGFKKVDDCHYENDNFKRDCHHLLKNMVRRNSNRPQIVSNTANDLQFLINHGIRNRAGSNSNDDLVARHDGPLSSRGVSVDELLANTSRTDSLSDSRYMPTTCSATNPLGFVANFHEPNNFRVLYQQLAALNQLPRSMIETNQLHSQQPTMSQMINNEMPDVETIANSSTDLASVTQSSLATVLYQRIANIATSANTNDRRSINQPTIFTSADQNVQPMNSLAQQIDPNLIATAVQQNPILTTRIQQPLISGLTGRTLIQNPAQTAQQILQQTLIRSLMQLKLAQLPQNYNQNLLTAIDYNQHTRPPCNIQILSPAHRQISSDDNLACSSSTQASISRQRVARSDISPAHNNERRLSDNSRLSSIAINADTSNNSMQMLVSSDTDDSSDNQGDCPADHTGTNRYEILAGHQKPGGLPLSRIGDYGRSSSSSSSRESRESRQRNTISSTVIGMNLINDNHSRSI